MKFTKKKSTDLCYCNAGTFRKENIHTYTGTDVCFESGYNGLDDTGSIPRSHYIQIANGATESIRWRPGVHSLGKAAEA
jgi:hypothetical protein